MARVPEADAHPVAQVQDLTVFRREELLKGGLGVGHGVQRLHRRPMAARLPFWFCHSASLSWMKAESRSMTDIS